MTPTQRLIKRLEAMEVKIPATAVFRRVSYKGSSANSAEAWSWMIWDPESEFGSEGIIVASYYTVTELLKESEWKLYPDHITPETLNVAPGWEK